MKPSGRLLGGSVLSAATLALACSALAADKGADKMPSDKELIASAMSAAPASVAKHAAIVAMGMDGKTRELRKGTNGWTCMPDDPNTPGPDPMCADKNAMEHLSAMMAKKDPPAGKVGFMYMLKGGTDPSNVDPYATKPEAGRKWIKTGPHVMIIGADQSFYDQYPKGPDPDTSAPYVMWGGTPYQHLMAPVK